MPEINALLRMAAGLIIVFMTVKAYMILANYVGKQVVSFLKDIKKK